MAVLNAVLQHLLHFFKCVRIPVLLARSLHHRHAWRLALLEGSTSRNLRSQWDLYEAVLFTTHLACGVIIDGNVLLTRKNRVLIKIGAKPP